MPVAMLCRFRLFLDCLEEGQYDAALGGGRRDEEKARAKERFFSHRDEFGQWDPKNQRPELWNVFNGRMSPGEHFRVFPVEQLDGDGRLAIHEGGGNPDSQSVFRS